MEHNIKSDTMLPIPKKKVVKQHSNPGLVNRACEIILCLLVILVMFPIYITVYGLILVLEGRPVIFKQQRLGKNGQPFMIWKFRTMTIHHRSSPYQAASWDKGVPDDFVFKSQIQSEVTTIGRFLRLFSLDELPQLFNILKGDMHFIGPRPEIPEIADCYNEQQRKRLTIKPGITGLAQVSGRSNINHGKKIEYDLYYIHHRSLRLDLKIIFLTCIKVLKTDGAI